MEDMSVGNVSICSVSSCACMLGRQRRQDVKFVKVVAQKQLCYHMYLIARGRACSCFHSGVGIYFRLVTRWDMYAANCVR